MTVFPLSKLTVLPAVPASLVLRTAPTIGAIFTAVPSDACSDCASAINVSPRQERSTRHQGLCSHEITSERCSRSGKPARGNGRASVTVSLLTQRVFGFAVGAAYRASGPDEQFRAFFFRHAMHSFVILGLATCVYVSHRWAAHRVRVLRAVQFHHAEMEKRLLESRLAAMQAQLEPGFLRQALERVERMYETDARTADRMLQDLITYLRVAIPKMPGNRS
jgi:hypothetical protein